MATGLWVRTPEEATIFHDYDEALKAVDRKHRKVSVIYLFHIGFVHCEWFKTKNRGSIPYYWKGGESNG